MPAAPTPMSGRRRIVVIATSVLICLLWAGGLVLALNVSSWILQPLPRMVRGAMAADGRVPAVAVTWVAVLLVLALIGRLIPTLLLTGLIAAVLALVNIAKLRLRGDPLLPSDASFLSQPGFLGEMVGPKALVLAILALISLVALGWLQTRLARRWLPNVHAGLHGRPLWLLRGARLATGVLCLALLLSAAHFNSPDNKWRQWFESTDLTWRTWDQRANYKRNGFVGGLLFNTPVAAMTRPPGYSRAQMTRIAERYRDRAALANASRTGSLDDLNIVSVLSESFSQPRWLRSVTWPYDPIPHTSKIMASTLSGRMLSPGYGGGTANIEFELLTGQSMGQFSPQTQIAYEQVVPQHAPYPSFVDWLRGQGHRTIALHPFTLRMYRRPDVYKIFGFDQIGDRSAMVSRRKEGGGRFISDRAAYGETLRQIRRQDKPVFMHLVSMQNHMPYGGQYPHPVPPTSGLDERHTRIAGQYARGLQISDHAMYDYLAELRTSPEPTAVIFYGDHLPAEVYPPALAAKQGERVTHETPFFVWSNRAGLVHTPQPTTSPTMFLPLLFEALKIPEPPVFALLDSLRAQLPAMDLGMYVDGEDRLRTRRELTAAQRRVLADYRLVQYDLSIGKRYSAEVLFGDPPR